DDSVGHLQVDGHRGAAQPGMGGRRGVRLFEAADSLDISGKAKNFRVIDVVYHRIPLCAVWRAWRVAAVSSIPHLKFLYSAYEAGTARRSVFRRFGRAHATSGPDRARVHQTRRGCEPFNSFLQRKELRETPSWTQ